MCNRLFHYMGFKNLIWIPEKDLKNYPDPSTVVYEAGEKFLMQHANYGSWSMGIYHQINETSPILKIRWLRVIIIKESPYGR
jgi:hypothetical protein